MAKTEGQDRFFSSGATLRLPPRMRLADAERERLWKGLERFVNCGDGPDDFLALSRSFSDLWPINVEHCPNQETTDPIGIPELRARVSEVDPPDKKRELSEWELSTKLQDASQEDLQSLWKTDSLNWNPVSHKLFLFFRDMLRRVWRGANESTEWLAGGEPEFLMGLNDWNESARSDAKEHNRPLIFPPYPVDLYTAWETILRDFPTARPEPARKFRLVWDRGDFELVPGNDFQRAFFFLFRQSWKARICDRCAMFFLAQRPKQKFCGTTCSGGNRLASKLKWWNRVGAKKRAAQLRYRRKAGTNRKARKRT
jgi:hypothetical protein